MNKKLFSWKALAGLALLVAMGLTSCKNNTEVDPNDPYNTKTPTQPGTTTKGTADVTITILTTADLSKQWSALDSKTKEALREKTTLNVAINSASYKLDGSKLDLPNFFAGATNGSTGKIVNVTFTSGFTNADYMNTGKDGKKALYINTDKLAGNQVNITLPAQDIDLTLEATMTETSLAAAGGNIGYFTSSTATNKSATSLLGGINVKRVNWQTGDLNVNGGNIEAKVITANEAQVLSGDGSGAGFAVGGQTSVKNLFIESGTPIITNINADNRAIGTITIAKGAGVILTENAPRVETIVGEDAGCTVTFTSVQTNAGNTTNLSKVGSVEKCKLTLGSGLILTNNVLKNVELLTAATMNNTAYAEGITFNALTLNFNADNQTATFNGCKFKAAPAFSGSFSTVTSSWSKTYQWVVSGTSGTWEEVTNAAPLKEYNKSEEVQEFASGDVDVVAGALVGNGWKVTSKVIKVNYQTTKQLVPENIFVALNNCKFDQATINAAFGNKTITDIWFTLTVDGAVCTWKQDTAGSYWPIKP
jgi:hypothetical protein